MARAVIQGQGQGQQQQEQRQGGGTGLQTTLLTYWDSGAAFLRGYEGDSYTPVLIWGADCRQELRHALCHCMGLCPRLPHPEALPSHVAQLSYGLAGSAAGGVGAAGSRAAAGGGGGRAQMRSVGAAAAAAGGIKARDLGLGLGLPRDMFDDAEQVIATGSAAAAIAGLAAVCAATWKCERTLLHQVTPPSSLCPCSYCLFLPLLSNTSSLSGAAA